MKPVFKIEKLIRSMKLFMDKADEERALFINGRLPPKLRKQMVSILKQADAINLEDL